MKSAETSLCIITDASLNTNSDKTYFSIDMQKVLMLPHIPGIKIALFTGRIIMINQSIVPLDSTEHKSRIKSPEDVCGMKLFMADEMKTLRM